MLRNAARAPGMDAEARREGKARLLSEMVISFMDLRKVIRSLIEEKNKLDSVIASLQSLEKQEDPARPVTSALGRRGRRAMGQEERRRVSERMKKYWAGRRKVSGASGTGPAAAD